MAETWENGGTSRLAGGILAADDTIQINAADIARFPDSGEYRLAITDGVNVELVLVTAGQGTDTLAVTRAVEQYNGEQQPYAFAGGSRVEHVLTLASIEALVGFIEGGGLQGPMGPEGPAGPAGAQGPAGPQGQAGAVGPAGLAWRGAWNTANAYAVNDAVGSAGASWFCIAAVGAGGAAPEADAVHWALLAAQGAQGAAGAQGVQGPQGAAGAQGPAGASGPQGPQGVAGPAGPQGVAGPAGPQGAQGVAGATGADGAQGPVGPQGPAGATGAAGGDGAQGPQGPVGLTGPAGAAGAAGAQGPAGADGAQGPAGPIGPAGLEWRGVWSAATAYVVDDAVSYGGASWFCIAGVPIGGPTPDVDPTHWALLAAQGAVGPQGPAGAAGAQGPQGPQGVQGVAGAAGADGAQGPAGPKGDTGDTGAAGAQGIQGPQGIQGIQGPTGPQGPQGAAGTTGAALLEEFAPAGGSTQLALSQVPSQVLVVTRNGVVQSLADGHYTRAGATLTFPLAFVAGDRVEVVYAVGTVGAAGPPGPNTGRREEFLPLSGATTVVLAVQPSQIMSVTRAGVAQSTADGNFSLAGATLTFTDAFDGTERVVVAYMSTTYTPGTALDNAGLASNVARPNLLQNGGFELWASGAVTVVAAAAAPLVNGPLDWVAATSGAGPTLTLSRESAIVDAGSQYSLKGIYAHTAGAWAFVSQPLPFGAQLSNKTVTAAIRVRCAVPNAVRIGVYDSTGIYTYSPYHTGDDTWQTLTATKVLGAANAGLGLVIWTDGGVSATFYADNATLVLGTVAVEYVPAVSYPDALPNERLASDVPRPNLLPNGGFEQWHFGPGPFDGVASTVAADQWSVQIAAPDTIAVSRDTANVDVASQYCAVVTVVKAGGAGIPALALLTNFFLQLRGKSVTVSVRVKTTVANAARLRMNDGVGGQQFSAYHSGGGAYETLSYTYAVAANATAFNVAVEFNLSGNYYVDNASLVIGTVAADYVPQVSLPDVIPNERLASDVARSSLLSNGGFEVWQRGNGPISFDASGAKRIADQWVGQVSGTNVATGTRDTTNIAPGSLACAAIANTFGTGVSRLFQPLGASLAEMGQLVGRTMTVSVSVRGATPGLPFRLFYTDYVATTGFSSTFITTASQATYSYTFTLAPGSTGLAVGVSFDASGTFYVDNAMLVVGPVAADYVPLHPADDLYRCLRYYQRWNAVNGVIVATGQVSNGAGFAVLPMQAPMGGTPTFTNTAGDWVTRIWGLGDYICTTLAPNAANGMSYSISLAAASSGSRDAFLLMARATTALSLEWNP